MKLQSHFFLAANYNFSRRKLKILSENDEEGRDISRQRYVEEARVNCLTRAGDLAVSPRAALRITPWESLNHLQPEYSICSRKDYFVRGR